MSSEDDRRDAWVRMLGWCVWSEEVGRWPRILFFAAFVQSPQLQESTFCNSDAWVRIEVGVCGARRWDGGRGSGNVNNQPRLQPGPTA